MMPGCMHKKSAAKSPLPRRKQIIGFGWFGLTQIQISPSCIRRTCLRIRGKDTQFPCGFDIIKLFYDFLAFVNIFSPYSLFLPSPQPHAPRTEHRLPECCPQGILKCAGGPPCTCPAKAESHAPNRKISTESRTFALVQK